MKKGAQRRFFFFKILVFVPAKPPATLFKMQKSTFFSLK
jgi:hypothetical protein